MNLVESVPKAINPCPIKSAVIELRYDDSLLDPSLAIGVLFSKLNEDNFFIGKFERLPLSDVPVEVRERDPALRYAPLFQIVGEKYLVRLSTNAISVSVVGEYCGWDDFYLISCDIFKMVKNLGFFDCINRVGIRYTSFFDFNVLELLNFKFDIAGTNQKDLPTHIQTEVLINFFKATIKLSNSAQLRDNSANKLLPGSSIDIDVFYAKDINDISKCIDIISNAHELEKKLFFTLVTDELLKKFEVIPHE